MANISPPPLQTPIVEFEAGPGVVRGAMTLSFANWLQELMNRTQQGTSSRAGLTLTGQSASLGTSVVVAQANGLYRVSYRLRVRTAAGVSSSVSFTVSTIEGGVACTQSSAALIANLASAPQSGSFLVHCDPSSPLSVSTTYASNPAAAMLYDLDVVVEALS